MKGLSPRFVVASTRADVERAAPVALMAPIQPSRRMASGLEMAMAALASPAVSPAACA